LDSARNERKIERALEFPAPDMNDPRQQTQLRPFPHLSPKEIPPVVRFTNQQRCSSTDCMFCLEREDAEDELKQTQQQSPDLSLLPFTKKSYQIYNADEKSDCKHCGLRISYDRDINKCQCLNLSDNDQKSLEQRGGYIRTPSDDEEEDEINPIEEKYEEEKDSECDADFEEKIKKLFEKFSSSK